MEPELSQKDQVYFKICHTVLKFEVKKGHLKWSISEVSRSSGVTRSLIYYYFGKEKKQILNESARFMVDFMFNKELEEPLGIAKGLRVVLDRLEKMPFLLHFFIQHKNANNEFGEIIRQAENWLLDVLQKYNPDLNKNEILKIYLLELGLMLYGRCDTEQLDYYFPLAPN